MDWPLSRDEKKSQVMRLYSQDVKAADRLIHDGHDDAVQSLRTQVEDIRRAIENEGFLVGRSLSGGSAADLQDTIANFEKLRGTVESQAAYLRALTIQKEVFGTLAERNCNEVHSPPQRKVERSRSEGRLRALSESECFPLTPLRSALSGTPRNLTPRRVSFGKKELIGDSDIEEQDRCLHGKNNDNSNNHSHRSSKSRSESPQRRYPRRSSIGEPEPEEDSASETVFEVLPELHADRDVVKLGFAIDEETTVSRIIPGSWAEKSGILPGDTFVELNGVQVRYLNCVGIHELLRCRPLRFLIERRRCTVSSSTTSAKKRKSNRRSSREAPHEEHGAGHGWVDTLYTLMGRS